MPVLPILLVGNPVLRETSLPVPVEQIKALKPFVESLIKTCKVAKGAGLSAPQVGDLRRVVVTNVGYPLVWVNPVIKGGLTSEFVKGPEGCLSVPGKLVEVTRNSAVDVEYYDLHGTKYEEVVTGILAVVLQHEIDHLNGILITDYEKANDQATEDR